MGERKLTITFESDFKNVDMARAAIQGICRGIYPAAESESQINEFCLAATEAMNNAVEHSGANMIEMELLAGENEMALRLSANGEKFDPTAKVSYPDLDSPDGLPEGGFGRAIIREMADSREYEYINGKNILTLKKCFLKNKKENNNYAN